MENKLSRNLRKALQESRKAPDAEFQENSGLKLDGDPIVKMWKLLPDVKAVETKGRKLGLVVNKSQMNDIPNFVDLRYATRRRIKDLYFFGPDELPDIFYALPKWKAVFERTMGVRIPSEFKNLTWGTKNSLIAQGKVPLGPQGAEAVFRDMKWKHVKSDPSFDGWEGSIDRVKLRVFVDVMQRTIIAVPAGKTPGSVSYGDYSAYRDEVKTEFRYDGLTTSEFKEKLRQVAKRVKAKRTRKTVDVSALEWGDYQGKVALDKWLEMVTELIQREYINNPYFANREFSSNDVVYDVLDNYGRRIEGFTRAQMSQRIVGVLKRFVKEGKLRKYGKEWEVV